MNYMLNRVDLFQGSGGFRCKFGLIALCPEAAKGQGWQGEEKMTSTENLRSFRDIRRHFASER